MHGKPIKAHVCARLQTGWLARPMHLAAATMATAGFDAQPSMLMSTSGQRQLEAGTVHATSACIGLPAGLCTPTAAVAACA